MIKPIPAALALVLSLPVFSGPSFASDRGRGAVVGRSAIGPTDQLGRLSMMTPASRAEVLTRMRGDAVYDLAQDFFSGMPSFTEAGDPPYQFWLTHTPTGAQRDDPFKASAEARATVAYTGDAISMYTHVGTHIDSLNHFGLHGRIWNGFSAGEHLGDRGWDVNGADRIPPIVARGVLIDLPRSKGLTELPANHRITPQDVRAALTAQRIAIRRGDVVLIRTGKGAFFNDANAYKRAPAAITVATAQWIAAQGAMIVGVDMINPEPVPSEHDDNYLPVHTFLLGEQGMPIIENLNLEAPARDRVYEFAFIGTPLKLRGASGAPIRPIAMALEPLDPVSSIEGP